MQQQLSYHIQNNQYDVAKVLISDRTVAGSILFCTIRESKFGLNEEKDNKVMDFIKFLIDYKADVNFQCGKPICEAVFAQQLDLVKLLVNSGADIHIRDDIVAYMANAYPEESMNGYLALHNIKVDPSMATVVDDNGRINWQNYDKELFEDWQQYECDTDLYNREPEPEPEPEPDNICAPYPLKNSVEGAIKGDRYHQRQRYVWKKKVNRPD
jgi:hypothetical protein